MGDKIKLLVHSYEGSVSGVFNLVFCTAGEDEALEWGWKFYRIFDPNCTFEDFCRISQLRRLPDPPLIEATLSGEPIWVIPYSPAANDNEKPGWRSFVYPDENRVRFQPSGKMYLGWPTLRTPFSTDPNTGEFIPCG